MKRWLPLAVLLLALPANAAEPLRLLILPFDNATGQARQDPLEAGIADLLTACFSRHGGSVEVVERGALTELIDEQSLRRLGSDGGDLQGVAGRLSGARYLLRGSFERRRGGLTVRAFLHDTATTALVFSSEAGGAAADLTQTLCDGIAAEVASFLAGDAAAGPDLALDRAPQTSQLLIVGMGHYYNGDYGAAMPAFMKLLRQDAQSAEARFWLAQSFHRAGLSEYAEVVIRKFLDMFAEHERRDQALSLLREIENKHGRKDD